MITKGSFIKAAFICNCLFISGCQQSLFDVSEHESRSSIENEQSNKVREDEERLRQCQQALKLLGEFETNHYAALRVEFTSLMANAAKYGNVRPWINDGTQDTLDSLYRYRVSRLCTEIEQRMLETLIERLDEKP